MPVIDRQTLRDLEELGGGLQFLDNLVDGLHARYRAAVRTDRTHDCDALNAPVP